LDYTNGDKNYLETQFNHGDSPQHSRPVEEPVGKVALPAEPDQDKLQQWIKDNPEEAAKHPEVASEVQAAQTSQVDQAKKLADQFGGNWLDYIGSRLQSALTLQQPPAKYPPAEEGGRYLQWLETPQRTVQPIVQHFLTDKLLPAMGRAETDESVQQGPRPPIAPIMTSGAPSPWARYGTSLEGVPGPSVPPVAPIANQPARGDSINTRFLVPTASTEEQRPGGGSENPEIGSFADTPRLALQEHVNQLSPGQRFVWHDGQEYIKT
jgi:hypothetical protein